MRREIFICLIVPLSLLSMLGGKSYAEYKLTARWDSKLLGLFTTSILSNLEGQRVAVEPVDNPPGEVINIPPPQSDYTFLTCWQVSTSPGTTDFTYGRHCAPYKDYYSSGDPNQDLYVHNSFSPWYTSIKIESGPEFTPIREWERIVLPSEPDASQFTYKNHGSSENYSNFTYDGKLEVVIGCSEVRESSLNTEPEKTCLENSLGCIANYKKVIDCREPYTCVDSCAFGSCVETTQIVGNRFFSYNTAGQKEQEMKECESLARKTILNEPEYFPNRGEQNGGQSDLWEIYTIYEDIDTIRRTVAQVLLKEFHCIFWWDHSDDLFGYGDECDPKNFIRIHEDGYHISPI